MPGTRILWRSDIEGVGAMWWLIGGAAVVVSVGGWLFGPTIRALFGPDFEPSPKSDASVEAAINSRMIDGGS
jgi:hypothetical protein